MAYLFNTGTNYNLSYNYYIPYGYKLPVVVSTNSAYAGLPSGYTQVEYIESTGTQYIDTGIYYQPSTMESVKVSYNIISNVNYDNKFFGSYSGIGLTISSSNLRSAINGAWGWNLTSMTLGEHTDEFTYNGTNIYLYHDGILVQTVATSDFIDTRTLLIGMLNNESSLSNYIKIYNVKIGNLHNFIPAIRNSDNEVGMYDTVTQTFYTNQGTGTFTAGEEITDTTTNIYLSEQLKKVSTYADSVDFKTQLRTNNVGVKVLDGTESFVKESGRFFYTPSNMLNEGNVRSTNLLCSHFRANTSGQVGDCFKFSGQIYFYPDTTTYSTVALWQAYLAAQYAAGTPVTIYYPLATATTESVTLPTIAVSAGTNYIDVSSSVSPSEVSVTYKQ